MPDDPPPTWWEQHVVGERWHHYVDRLARKFADGDDLEGEGRFVDALAPRGAAVLDAGCGTGRVTAALHRMGHRTVGVDRDAGLIAIAQQRHTAPQFLTKDLLSLTPDWLRSHDAPPAFDVIVLAGNVMVYLARGTEPAVLSILSGLLTARGRLVTGFATDREYTVGDLDADAASAELALEHRFATWHLDPWRPDADWAVSVFRARP